MIAKSGATAINRVCQRRGRAAAAGPAAAADAGPAAEDK